jgi:hypothetical protein
MKQWLAEAKIPKSSLSWLAAHQQVQSIDSKANQSDWDFSRGVEIGVLKPKEVCISRASGTIIKMKIAAFCKAAIFT